MRFKWIDIVGIIGCIGSICLDWSGNRAILNPLFLCIVAKAKTFEAISNYPQMKLFQMSTMKHSIYLFRNSVCSIFPAFTLSHSGFWHFIKETVHFLWICFISALTNQLSYDAFWLFSSCNRNSISRPFWENPNSSKLKEVWSHEYPIHESLFYCFYPKKRDESTKFYSHHSFGWR